MTSEGRRLIDLSHAVEEGTITYPGIPAPRIGTLLSREASRARYAPGTEFYLGTIEMAANTGTYVDAPFHRYGDGADVAELPLTSLADLDGVLIRATKLPERAIGPAVFAEVDVRGRAVLVNTGWATRWGTESYFTGHPFLTSDAAVALRDAGAALVGIDSLNIDDTTGGERPAHSILLAAGIPIVEHLCGLERLPSRGFRLFAVPTKVRGLGSFPVRAYAIVSDDKSSEPSAIQ
jgi:kynurenine formamidase